METVTQNNYHTTEKIDCNINVISYNQRFSFFICKYKILNFFLRVEVFV